MLDPEVDEPVIIYSAEGEEQSEEGNLTVDWVSKLDFGTQKVTSNKGLYYANHVGVTELATDIDGNVVVDESGNPVPAKDADGKVLPKRERGVFVQVTDKRAGDAKGWTLSAKMTKQFTNANGKVLTGSTITFANPHVRTVSSYQPNFVSTFTLEADKSATADILKSDVAKGFGTYSIEFGKSDQKAANGGDAVDNSVQLMVPANTPIEVGAASAYEAEITWTISELPTV